MNSTTIFPLDKPLTSAITATRFVFLLFGLVIGGWAPMVPYVQTHLSLSPSVLGLALLAMGSGSMLSMPMVGWLSHRWGNARIIRLGAALLCLGLPILSCVSNLFELVVALLGFGVVLGAVDVGMNAHAIEVELQVKRSLMSGFHGIFSIGGLVGAGVISGLLILGQPLWLCTTFLSLLIALIILTQHPNLLETIPESKYHPSLTDESDESLFKKARAIPSFLWGLGALCFIGFLAEGSILDWSALFLRDFKHIPSSAAGLGYAIFSISIAIGRFLGTPFINRFGEVTIIRLGALLASLGFLIAILCPWAWTAWVGLAWVGLGISNVIPLMFSIAGKASSKSPALNISFVATLGTAGLLLGPGLIGFLAHLTSLPNALLFIAGLLIILAIFSGMVKKK